MHPAIQTLIAFAEGRLKSREFEQFLYSEPEIEAVLSDDPDLGGQNYAWPSTYQFILELDYGHPGHVLSARGAIKDWLVRHQICDALDKVQDGTYDWLLKVQPKWLDIDAKYLAELLLPHSDDLKGADLDRWAREEIRRKFVCVSRPPKWLQSPNWPIEGAHPLVFIGQIDTRNYFHDDGCVYVFHNPKTNEYRLVTQVL